VARSISDKAAIALVLLAVLVAFVPALSGEFNWDDDIYVQANPLLRAASLSELAKILTTVVAGNYHPLTILSFLPEFRLVGADATLYHVTNVLLHLLNVALVWLLVRRLSPHAGAAWVAALVFGLHPLRVESVAWISARKDLLYTCFYLVSLVFYLRHTDDSRTSRSYFMALGAFLLALMSKGMAVTLSLALPLLDYLRGRRVTWRTVLEKLPFFALSLAFGSFAVWIQHQGGATTQDIARPLLERSYLAVQALAFYLGKLIAPFDLSAVYPYPEGTIGFPWAAMTVLLAVFALVVYSARRTRVLIFGVGFFLLNLAFVLQLLPVGGAMAADRDTYQASIGLALVAGEGYAWLRQRPRVGGAATAIVLVAAVALGVGSWQRCKVWHDRVTLFGDVIENYPRYYPAYDIRGLERSKRGDLAGAMEDFDEAIRLNPDFARAYNNRGNARSDLGDRRRALEDYDRALELAPEFALAHYNRGYVAGELGDIEGAIQSMSLAIRHDPGLAPAYINRADAYRWTGRYELSIADYTAAIRMAPESAAMCHYFRGESYARSGNVSRALEDVERAKSLGYPVDPQLLLRLRRQDEGH
jgi:tetratricopeptide (TPR) repeat protein